MPPPCCCRWTRWPARSPRAYPNAGVEARRRAEIVVGKWLAHLLIGAAYFPLLGGGIVLGMRVFMGYLAPHRARRAADLPRSRALLTVAIAGGTRLSTITNGMVAFGLAGFAFIASGWSKSNLSLFESSTAKYVGKTIVSLVSPFGRDVAARRLRDATARDVPHYGTGLSASSPCRAPP